MADKLSWKKQIIKFEEKMEFLLEKDRHLQDQHRKCKFFKESILPVSICSGGDFQVDERQTLFEQLIVEELVEDSELNHTNQLEFLAEQRLIENRIQLEFLATQRLQNPWLSGMATEECASSELNLKDSKTNNQQRQQ
jgi:hypothetical protein